MFGHSDPDLVATALRAAMSDTVMQGNLQFNHDSTEFAELLLDEGIGLDEVLLLVPGPEGTDVTPASSHRDIRDLLEGGLSLADAVMPKTRPERAEQLTLFGEA